MSCFARSCAALGSAGVLGVALAGGCGGGVAGVGLSGLVETADYVLPAGQTRSVSGDLTIAAPHSIRIDGTLLVPPGVSVVLVTDGSLTVTGSIAPAASRAASRPGVASRAGGAPPMVLIEAGTAEITGDVTSPAGTDIFLLGRSVLGSTPGVNITGSITTAAGKDGMKRGEKGGNSGSIELASARAIAAAPPLTGLAGFVGSYAAYDKVTVSGTIRTGPGGFGWNDDAGIMQGNTLVVEGTDGGNSGSVVILATDIDVTVATIVPGDGQTAGHARVAAPKTATDTYAPGVDVRATSGNGGNGGSVTLTGKVAGKAPVGGYGGGAGDVEVRAGNGGPGGPGGNAVALVGQTGKDGLPLPPFVTNIGRNASVHIGGGNGGASPDRHTTGGKGGDVTVTGRDGITAAVVEDKIHGYNFSGEGAQGFSGCSVKPPFNGTDGGPGGSLIVKGVPYDFTGAMNGGNGGDGQGPGARGIGGSDDQGNKVGKDGKDGNPCPGTSLGFDGTRFQPERSGSRFAYHYVFGGTTTLDFEARVGAPAILAGIPVAVSPHDNYVGGVRSSTFYFTSDSTAGVQEWGRDYYGTVTQSVRLAPPLRLKQGLLVGDTDSQDVVQTTTVTGQPTTTTNFTRTVTFVGTETVTVPAGVYPGCARLHILTYVGGKVSEDRTTYLAPNVGLVSTTTTDGEVQTLTSYTAGP